MKNLIAGLCVFAAFFSSCNVFTLTGAQTKIGTRNNFAPADMPPIVTSASIKDMYTGSMSSCGAGEVVTFYGTGFSTDTTVTIFDTANGTTYSGVISAVTNTEIDVTLPSGIPGGKNLGIHVSNSNGESKAYAFRTGCA